MLNQKWEEHHEMIDAELHGGNFLLRRNCSCAVKAVNGNLDRAMFPSTSRICASVSVLLQKCRSNSAGIAASA